VVSNAAEEITVTTAGAAPLDVEPFGPEVRQDPWPAYRHYRDAAAINRMADGGWLTMRFAECGDVLRDRRFGSDPAKLNEAGRASVGGNDVYVPGSPILLFLDPPDHTRIRSLVSKAFTPGTVSRLRPWVEGLVDELLDEQIESGEIELLADLAYPLPAEVICQLLGVPAHDRDQFREWSAAGSRMLDGNLDPATREAGVLAVMRLFAYFAELLEERRRDPRDDLLSGLVAAEEAGDRLTPEELISTVVLLFVAGHETTMNLIGNGVLAMLDHPEQLALLRADPSRVRAAVEEALRYEGTVQLVPRVALEPVTIGDAHLEEGDSVIVGLAAANRDPRRFTDPDVFDLTRADAGHLAFALGPHHCLGAALARLETEVTFAAVARRLHDLELVGERPRYRAHAILRGLEALPLRFTPSARS
jgi:cytochrome P450